MNNKRNVISCLFAVGVVLGASSATLTVNQVRHRFPARCYPLCGV